MDEPIQVQASDPAMSESGQQIRLQALQAGQSLVGTWPIKPAASWLQVDGAPRAFPGTINCHRAARPVRSSMERLLEVDWQDDRATASTLLLPY